MNKIKVLFASANPDGTSILKLDEEIRVITTKIRAAEHRDLLEITSIWATRPDDLIQALNEHKPHVVHFSGHGSSKGQVVLTDDRGFPKPVTTIAIRALFRTLADNVRVIVFNACYSRILALAVTEVIDCAIGMKSAIGDQAAIAFAASFYRAIGFGRSVQEAFEQGKVALLLEGIPEHNIPDLLARAGVDPSQLFLLSTSGERFFREIEPSQHYQSGVERTSVRRVDTDDLARSVQSILDSYKHHLSGEKPVSLIYLDLDKFAGINSRFGTGVGDEAIRIVQSILEDMYQHHHYIARWSKDEFIVCMRKSAEKAAKSAKHLQERIQSYPWSDIAPSLYVTGSIGIAQLENERDAVEWILRAIQGAESAKKAGGNSVRFGPHSVPKTFSRRLDDYTSP